MRCSVTVRQFKVWGFRSGGKGCHGFSRSWSLIQRAGFSRPDSAGRVHRPESSALSLTAGAGLNLNAAVHSILPMAPSEAYSRAVVVQGPVGDASPLSPSRTIALGQLDVEQRRDTAAGNRGSERGRADDSTGADRRGELAEVSGLSYRARSLLCKRQIRRQTAPCEDAGDRARHRVDCRATDAAGSAAVTYPRAAVARAKMSRSCCRIRAAG